MSLAVLIPTAAAEQCPPPGSIVYAGPCDSDGDAGEDETTGVWVQETSVIVYDRDCGRDGSSGFSNCDYCFLGLLYYTQNPTLRVGFC